jgi:hypothetical protein
MGRLLSISVSKVRITALIVGDGEQTTHSSGVSPCRVIIDIKLCYREKPIIEIAGERYWVSSA